MLEEGWRVKAEKNEDGWRKGEGLKKRERRMVGNKINEREGLEGWKERKGWNETGGKRWLVGRRREGE